MQFSTFIGVAALIAPTWAIQFTNFPFPTNLVAGQPFTLTWNEATTGPVTLTLRQGDRSNLDTIGQIATVQSSGATGSYTWTPSPSEIEAVRNTNYAVQISQGSSINYSQQFSITGGTATSPVSASASNAISSIAASASSRASSIIASASSVVSSIANSTVTRTSGSSTVSTATSTRASSTSATGSPAPTSNAAAGVAIAQSPIALIFGAVAAIAYLG